MGAFSFHLQNYELLNYSLLHFEKKTVCCILLFIAPVNRNMCLFKKISFIFSVLFTFWVEGQIVNDRHCFVYFLSVFLCWRLREGDCIKNFYFKFTYKLHNIFCQKLSYQQCIRFDSNPSEVHRTYVRKSTP